MKLSKTIKAGRSDEPRLQYAALPWRAHGRQEILLVSTRGTRRWIIPKGWPMKGRAPHAAAAQEALEEAGVIGKIGKRTLGAFHYLKRAPSGDVPCKVVVFPLGVTRQRKTWPESKERVTRWFSFDEAAEVVQQPELRRLILEFGGWLEKRSKSSADNKKGPHGRGAAAAAGGREEALRDAHVLGGTQPSAPV